jgi:LAO/AO transport system kinase
MRALLAEGLEATLLAHPHVSALLPEVEAEVAAGTLPPRVAVQRILEAFARV